jgi:hypothetical protein
MFESVGFEMAPEKNEVGREMKYLGVHLDTVNMTMRFDATQSRGMRLELLSFVRHLEKGGHLDHSTVRHVCGKFNWYSEVVQSGRMHISAWWAYEKHLSGLYPRTFNKLLLDSQWWVDLLQSWEDGLSAGVEYPILSADVLLNDNESIMIVQSDASGTDGFGYYFGYFRSEGLEYVSKQWPRERVLISSHTDELWALCDYLEFRCKVRGAILVWITDSESAMWSVNKGRCFEPSGLDLVERILNRCDLYQLQIVALWVPRELNELADYLSHLSFLVGREEVSGTWAASELFSEPVGGADRQYE